MASNATSQIKDIVNDETGETTFDFADMIFDGAVSATMAIWGGNGASYGNTAGIKAAWNQLSKKGFSDPKAVAYFCKTAHSAGGKFVFDALSNSLKLNNRASGIITIKNLIRGAFK